MTDSSVNEKSSSDSLSTIDPNVLAVFNQYISEAFRVEKPEMTTDDNDKSKRFLVNLLSPKDGGKYGRAEFWDIYDRNNNSHYPFVIKKNKGMDLADVMTLTTIEAKVLQYLTNKNLQAVDYCKHRGDLLMTKFLEGRTLEEYIQEKGSLPPQIILNIIDSMPKIHSALNEMMIEGKGDISPLEVQYHKQRAFRLVREGTPGLPRYIKEV